MIKSFKQYIIYEIWPRKYDILFGSELWLSVLLSIFFFFLSGRLFYVTIKTEILISAIITYASIALGFCITGLTIALMIQEKEIALKLIKTVIKKNRNALSDLLFVFSWTALCHCIVIALSIWIMLLYNDYIIVNNEVNHSYKIIFCFYSFSCIYSIMQFFITIITLSQVGNVYIKLVEKNDKKETKDK